jgi:hypothetical protein
MSRPRSQSRHSAKHPRTRSPSASFTLRIPAHRLDQRQLDAFCELLDELQHDRPAPARDPRHHDHPNT